MMTFEDAKQHQLQVVSLFVTLITFYLILYLASSLDLGFAVYLLQILFKALSSIFGLAGITLFIYVKIWDLWKKIPNGMHVIISFGYLFLMGLLLPSAWNKVNYDYEKTK